MRHDTGHASNLLLGLCLGALAGAAVMLLYAPREGRGLRLLRHWRDARLSQSPEIDEEIEQSFPASDPPSWTTGAS